MDGKNLKVSAPGRICLFGEHQDYLNLPVIACAISRRIIIEGVKRNDHFFNIEMPDIRSSESFEFSGKLKYTNPRDYFRSALNILTNEGYAFSHGCDCRIPFMHIHCANRCRI
jgi:galactokinase